MRGQTWLLWEVAVAVVVRKSDRERERGIMDFLQLANSNVSSYTYLQFVGNVTL